MQKKFLTNSRIVVLASGLLLSIIAPIFSPIAHAQSAEFNSLAWLAGCWQRENSEAGTIEQWMPPAGESMLGMARTVKKGKTVEHEFMQIRVNAEGKLIYIALPSGQAETTFTLRQVSEQSIEFENPKHDFPQRVRYQLQAPNKLLARIEGVSKGKERGIDFPMLRVVCQAK